MYQIVSGFHVHGHYGELEALASAHLTLYSLMSGGLTDWSQPLDIVCEWLSNSNLMVDENPRSSLMLMTPTGRLAAKLALVSFRVIRRYYNDAKCIVLLHFKQWLDIVSSVSLAQPPRFLALLRRLGGATPDSSGGTPAPVLWARAPGEPAPESSVESVSGAPDVLSLALAETAALHYWKTQELRKGALSVRELVRRADTIEHALKRAIGPTPFSPSPMSRRPSMDGGGLHMDMDPLDLRRTVVELLKETAVLYIATVVSGHSPGKCRFSWQSICRHTLTNSLDSQPYPKLPHQSRPLLSNCRTFPRATQTVPSSFRSSWPVPLRTIPASATSSPLDSRPISLPMAPPSPWSISCKGCGGNATHTALAVTGDASLARCGSMSSCFDDPKQRTPPLRLYPLDLALHAHCFSDLASTLSLPFLVVCSVLLALPSSPDVLGLELYCSRIIARTPRTVL
jgi:hypothetical protein